MQGMAVVKAKELMEGDVMEIAQMPVKINKVVLKNGRVYVVGRTLETNRLARWETEEETVVLIFYTVIH